MPIITLTTDLGDTDHYVGALKGFLLSRHPEVRIVDISHHIKPFDVAGAAFVLGNAFRQFPAGTIHLAQVQGSIGSASRDLIVSFENHLFVGPDNGLFSMVVGDAPKACFTLNQNEGSTSSALDELASVAISLCEGKSPADLGTSTNSIEELAVLRPAISAEGVRCNVIHVDHFGNAVLNLSRKVFEEVSRGRSFALQLRGGHELREISKAYWDQPEGELLCLFNSSGLLEVAVNLGRASDLVGLRVGESIRLWFE